MGYKTMTTREKEIVTIAENKKGRFASMTYAKPLKLKKGNPYGEITKITKVKNIRFGASYDNLKQVAEAREKGDLPAENQGISYARHISDVLLENIKNPDVKYLQVAVVPDKTEFITEYYSGNEKIDIQDIKPYMYAKSSDKPLYVFSVKLDSIIEIK